MFEISDYIWKLKAYQHHILGILWIKLINNLGESKKQNLIYYIIIIQNS